MTGQMYVISYDITENKMRRKVAEELENFGVRIQYSVFECRISKSRFQELYKRLLNLTSGMEEGSVRIYPICEKCREKIQTIGKPLHQVEKLSVQTIII